MIAVARAQLGRKNGNFHYNEQWCADFVSDVAILAGQQSAIPFSNKCLVLINKMRNAGASEVPFNAAKRGDIVFFGMDGRDNVEIITKDCLSRQWYQDTVLINTKTVKQFRLCVLQSQIIYYCLMILEAHITSKYELTTAIPKFTLPGIVT